MGKISKTLEKKIQELYPDDPTVLEWVKKLSNNQKDMPVEYIDFVNENFWDLI